MICADCGGENRKSARFCSWCGMRMALRCAVCATDIVAGAEFCDACGTPVGEPAHTPAPLGARKVVTVVFADLAGSTSQAEQMDPEAVRGFLDAYYAAVRDAVEDEGGRVVKLMGDGVMAAFGVPRVSEDDGKRAVRAAVAMQNAFATLADRALQQFGTPVALRVGVNTGEVVVATGDNDVVGDAVNVAARLEAAAGPGEVLIGESTWRLVRDTITLDALPPLEVKGKAEPVRAFRVVSLDPPVSDTPIGTTSFVGRDAELARLVDHFEDAVVAGETRLVSVIGSPGVGKSRLSRELATALASSARILEAGCPPAGGSTFGPIADLLRDAGDWAADRDAFDRLFAMLGAGGPASPEALFLAIRRVLTDIARDQPLVVVLDDIHWAEPMLLDLLEHLAEWGRDAPVLIAGLARPELRDLRPALAEGGRRVAGVVVLEGLGGEASQRLARDLLGAGDLPAAIAGKLLAVTEGNPLFLRELVRMLVDDGVLVRDGDTWITSVNADELDVPPTVHALLSARIERLDADERIILERAAVIGPQFPRGGVAAIAPSTIADELETHLEALRRRELVEPEGSYWGDEPLYRFHHVLIRDAAYRGLLRETRADLHERYGDWLEAKLGDKAIEQAEVLGFHFERAHEERQQLTGEPAPELGGRAARWLADAGRRALERDDVGAAAGLLGRALDRVPEEDDTRPSLLIDRAEAVLAAGDVATGEACVTVLRTLFAGDSRLEPWAECFGGQLANMTDPGRLHTTVEEVAAAAERLSAIDDFAGAAKAHGVRAQALARLGRIAECEKALDKALAAARQAGDLRRANSVLAGAPLAALWGPSPVARASGKCLDVVRVLRITSGSPAVEATALRCQAVLEALRGRDDAARRMLAAARSSLEELGLRSGLLETDVFAGLIDLLAGEPEAAERHLRRAHDGFRELGVDVDAAQTAALLARSVLAQGRDDEALALTEESERRGGEDLKTAIAWRSARAEALARRGELTEALRLARYAVTLAQPTDLVIDHADACSALATVLRLAGRHEEAEEQARVAADLYESKGATAAISPPSTAAVAAGAPALAAPVQQPAPPVPPNRASAARRRVSELAAAHRWDDMAALIAEDVVNDDRANAVTFGRDAWINDLKYTHSIDVAVTCETVGSRGDKVSLDRMRWSGDHPRSGPFESEHLVITELDERGLIAKTVRLEGHDENAAFEELDQRYLTGDAASVATEATVIQEWIRLYNERDWDAYASVWTEGFRVVDHRHAGWGELDGPGYVEVLRGMADLAPDIRARSLTADVRPGGGVALISAVGTAVTGGPIDLGLVMEFAVEGGKLTRVDIFPPEKFVPASSAGDTRIENRALRVAAAVQNAAFHHDWEAMRSRSDAGITLIDRRAGSQTVSSGIDAYLLEMRVIASAVRDADVEVLAVRGERLALRRLTGRGDDQFGNSFEVPFLQISEIDERDRLVAVTNFDAHDLDGAFDALDQRFEQLEPGFAPAGLFFRAFNTRAWELVARALHDDFAFADLPGGAGTLHKETYLDYLRAASDLAPDVRLRILATPVTTKAGVVAQVTLVGRGLGGAAVDAPAYAVIAIRDGRLWRVERLSAGNHDAAAARLATLAPELDVYEPGHLVLFDVHEFDAHALLAQRDIADVSPDLITALDLVLAVPRVFNQGVSEQLADLTHSGFRLVDHTPLGFGEIDAQAWASVGATVADLAPDTSMHLSEIRVTPTATLSVLEFSGSGMGGGPTEMTVVLVGALRDGKYERSHRFAPDQLDVARARFEELATEADRVPESAVTRLYGPLTGPDWIDRHWDYFVSIHAPDVVVEARTTAGERYRTEGRDNCMAEARSLYDMGLTTITVEPLAVRGEHIALLRFLNTGSHAEHGGGAADVDQFCVVETNDDGLIQHVVIFEPELRADAEEELENRYAALEAPLLSNAASRILDPFDWDRFISFPASDDMVVHDRRKVAQTSIFGAAEANAHAEAFPTTRAEVTTLAVRGDRLSLQHVVFVGNAAHGGGEVETDVLLIHELNGDGLLVRAVGFDLEDVEAAYDELNRRYMQGEGAQHADRVRLLERATALINARDWDSWIELYTSEFIYVDHHTVGFGVTDRYGLMRIQREYVELAPDTHWEIPQIHRLAEGGAVLEMRSRSSGLAGGVTEMRRLLATVFEDQKCARMESFPYERLEDALARFDELTASRPATDLLSNEATRAIRLEDGQSVGFAVDIVAEDRRSANMTVIEGRSAAIDSILALELPVVSADVIAVRGDRLALRRVVRRGDAPHGGGEAEVAMLILHELNDHGEIGHAIVFEEHAVDAALDELERRYAPTPEDWVTAQAEAFNERNWDAMAVLMSPDFTFLDRGPFRLDPMDRAEYLGWLRMYAEATKGTRSDIRVVHALSDSVILYESAITTADVDAPATTHHCVAFVEDGVCERIEAFYWDDLDSARTRFNELLARSPIERVLGEDGVITRGARHGLARSDDDFRVLRVNDEGEVADEELFVGPSLVKAVIRLEEMYAADEAEGEELRASRIRLAAWRSVAAIGVDWEAVAAGYAPAFQMIDHTPLGLSTASGGAAVTSAAQFFSQGGDFSVDVTDISYYGRFSSVITMNNRGSDVYGGDFELPYIAVTQMGDAGIERIELFGVDAMDEAIATAKRLDS